MNSIFVTFTPYHICIALGLAKQQSKQAKNYLIIVNHFSDASLYKAVLENNADNPFYRIIILAGVSKESSTNGIKQVIYSLYNKYIAFISLRKVLGTQTTTYTFNDQFFESQYLQYLTYKTGGNNICVEDGSAFYNNSITKNRAAIINKFLRLIRGRCYQYVTVMGTYKYSLQLMALYPDKVRKELRTKKIHMLSHDVFDAIEEIGLHNDIVLKYGYNAPDSIDCLILLPHSSVLCNEEVHNAYIKIIDFLVRQKYSIAVKLHPRDEELAILSIFGDKVYALPKCLAAEILYEILKNKPPKLVLGDLSTSLITAKVILKEVPVVSIAYLMNHIIDKTNPLMSLFKSIDISMPSNVEELNDTLKSILHPKRL